MTKSHWLVLVGTVVSAGISAWIHGGGPNPVVAGVPLLTGLLGVLATFMQSPGSGGAS